MILHFSHHQKVSATTLGGKREKKREEVVASWSLALVCRTHFEFSTRTDNFKISASAHVVCNDSTFEVANIASPRYCLSAALPFWRRREKEKGKRKKKENRQKKKQRKAWMQLEIGSGPRPVTSGC